MSKKHDHSHAHPHSHGHAHFHGHHHHRPEAHPHDSTRNIAIAFALNLGFAVIELFGGWWTQSVAIQADAIHDFGDSLALAAALGLQIWSSTEARGRFNFGFKRLSLLSALCTSLILIGGSVYISFSAIDRLFNPVTPQLNGMLGLAVLGVVINGFAAWKISHGKTQNERALSWHMIEDLLGWIAVLVGSVVMRYVDAPWIDPVLSFIIAGIVITGASRNLLASSQLFLQAAPDIELAGIKSEIQAIPQMMSINAFKVWSLDGAHHVATLHLSLVADVEPGVRGEIKQKIREIMDRHGQFDVTIEWDDSL